jgi:hypothetical protein
VKCVYVYIIKGVMSICGHDATLMFNGSSFCVAHIEEVVWKDLNQNHGFYKVGGEIRR